MKVTFHINSSSYDKFLKGKEVDLCTSDGWASHIKITARHSEVMFVGSNSVKRINIPTGGHTGPG